MGKLSKKIEDVKYEVYNALHTEYDDFIPNLTSTLELSNQVRSVSEDMQNLSQQIEKEIQSQLNVSASEYHDLSSRLHESNGILGILDKLVQIHDSLQAVKKGLTQKEFVNCADSLDKIQNLLICPEDDRTNEIQILSALKTEYTVQRETLKHSITEAWKETVVWLLPEKGDNDSNTVSSVTVCSSNRKALLSNILQGMEHVDILTVELKKFAHTFVNYIVMPIILNKGTTVKVNSNDKRLTVVSSSSGEVTTPLEVFANLYLVLEFIDQHIFATKLKNGQPSMQRLGSVLSNKMLTSIIENCLAPSIPTNTRDLEPYKAVVKATEAFQEKLLEYGLIGKENDELVKYVSNINALFANKKCQDLLQKARTLMTTEIHNMVLVAGEEAASDSPEHDGKNRKRKTDPMQGSGNLSANTFKLPKCYISESVESLVQLTYDTLHEAHTSSPQCAVQLFYTVRNMFELFSTVVPTYHRDSVTKLPQLAALHHNNCMYIAHHLTTLGHQFRQHLSESKPLQQVTCTFLDYVPLIRQLGTDCLLAQMSRQREQLMECLQGANGFSNVAEGDTAEATERAIKQVLFQLNHLQNVWQEVLPETVYFKAIGTLLNSVVVEMVTCVTDLEDISADDATLLHSVAMIIVEKAPKYFESENPDNNSLASLQKYTPKWNKFKELLLVLNDGLAEISDRWADGKGPLANEFSASEIKQLIRALFQNTDRRSAVLSRIK